jgi:hypothetical protein
MQPLSKLIVRNNGLFRKVDGDETRIDIPFENHGGREEYNGRRVRFQGVIRRSGA